MRVLVIDDSIDTVRFLSGAAKAEQVDEATSGEEALAFATQTTYDLITLDIRMPGVTGLDILSVLRSLCPHAVIAIISGHLMDTAENQSVESYADVLIGKPVSLERFKRLLSLADELGDIRQRIRKLSEWTESIT